MELSKMTQLKEKVRSGSNFSDTWHFFMDHFGENHSFLTLGEGVRESQLEVIIQRIATQLFTEPIQISDMFLTRVAEHRFIHGGLFINNQLCTVLYFEELMMGMLAVATPPPTPMKFCRFSVPPRTPGIRSGEPSVN